MRNKVTACIRHGDHLYGFDESMLRCMDLDGNVTWRVRGLGLGSMAIAGDRLLILNSDGELIVAAASPAAFRELSRRKVLADGVYWTMPVLKDGLIYVRNSLGYLVCLDHRLDPAATAAGTKPEVGAVPPPAALFARHRAMIGGDALATDQALRLRGKWSVPLRGLNDGAATWTMARGDRWDLRLDSMEFLYAFDGRQGWAVEPQGTRLIEGEELIELARLFPLEFFAPACPEGAVTEPEPARFDERSCWKVTSPFANGRRVHYFDQRTGRLAGSDGPGLSTLVLRGDFKLGALTLPASVTRFRADDGQQHVIRIESAAWLPVTEAMFAPTAEVRRRMRTPAEIKRATAALRKRFAAALGRYKVQESELRGDELRLVVRQGDLLLLTPGPELRVRVEDERNKMFPVAGDSLHISLEVDGDGRVQGLALRMQGPKDKPISARRVAR